MGEALRAIFFSWKGFTVLSFFFLSLLYMESLRVGTLNVSRERDR